MQILHSSWIPDTVADWPNQLATLTRSAWTGRNGRCYFPYRPLTKPEHWREHVSQLWDDENMHSWVLVVDGRIVAHSALVKKLEYWELGRWVAYPDAPHGAVTNLCTKAMELATRDGMRVQVECTQAHVHSQHICERLGLRWAGIGILEHAEDGTWWDIIYYDNRKGLQPFDPNNYNDQQIIGDPLGQVVKAHNGHLGRLSEISGLITTEPGGELPPKLFHILPNRRDALERTLTRVLGNPRASP